MIWGYPGIPYKPSLSTVCWAEDTPQHRCLSLGFASADALVAEVGGGCHAPCFVEIAFIKRDSETPYFFTCFFVHTEVPEKNTDDSDDNTIWECIF